MEDEPVNDVYSSAGSKEETNDLLVDEVQKPDMKTESSCAVAIKKEPALVAIVEDNTCLNDHGLNPVIQNHSSKAEYETTEMESESVTNSSFNVEVKKEPAVVAIVEDACLRDHGPNQVIENCSPKSEDESTIETAEMDFNSEVKKEPSSDDDITEINGMMGTAHNCDAKVKKEIPEEEMGPTNTANGHDVDNDCSSDTEKIKSDEIIVADKEHNTQRENRVGIAKRLRKIIPGQLIRFEDIYFSPMYPSGRKKKTNKASGSAKVSGNSKISGSSKVSDNNKRKRARARKYSCETCGKGFYSQDVLKSHCLRHTGGKRFTCDICGKGYSWHTSYQNHMLTHTGETPYKCSYCDKILCNKLSLQGHVMRIHNKVEKTFVCDQCDRRFINKYELKYHKANHEEQRRFMCDMCGKSLSTKNDLASHRLIHTGERPFTCSLCQKGFIRKSQLEEHMRQHTDGYSYQCEICGKQYSSKRSLQRHLLIHSDTRPYKCNQCEKDFKCRSALASHKDSHLGIKRHICEFCGKAFLSEPNMHKHKKRHLGVKNEVCVLCTKAFITKQELRAHMRSHTREPRVKKKAKVDGGSSICRSPVSLVVPISSGVSSNNSSTLEDLKEENPSPASTKCINENQNCNTAIVYLNTESESSTGDEYPASSDIPTFPEKQTSLLNPLKMEDEDTEESKTCDFSVSQNTDMSASSEDLVNKRGRSSPVPSAYLEKNQNSNATFPKMEKT